MPRALLTLPVAAVVLTFGGCTASDPWPRDSTPIQPDSRHAAAPIVLEWGQTAKFAHVEVTVRQPIYGRQTPDNGSGIAYTVALTNHGKTAVTVVATHHADGKPQRSAGDDPLAGRSIEPGNTDNIEQVTTVPRGTKRFTVDIEVRAGDSPSRKWRGKITGQPTSAAPAPEATQLRPLDTDMPG